MQLQASVLAACMAAAAAGAAAWLAVRWRQLERIQIARNRLWNRGR